MSRCPHCHGTGQKIAPQHVAPTRLRPMLPFGREVHDALQSNRLHFAPHLFVATCPGNESRQALDRWELARKHIARLGLGSAMVLRECENIDDFRLPALPRFAPFDLSLVAWAYGWSAENVDALGRSLVMAGIDAVQVLCGQDGPKTYTAQ